MTGARFEEIRYEVEDGVLTVTLNRPGTLNALTSTMLAELFDPWETTRPFAP